MQTGSGKTFTMEGGDESYNQGIIPRTIEKIYEETKILSGKVMIENNILNASMIFLRDLLFNFPHF